GAIDQNVDPSRAGNHAFDKFLEGIPRSHVARHEIALSAMRLDLRQVSLGLFADPAHENDFGACPCQADRHRSAELAGSPNDHGGLALQPEKLFEESCGLHGAEPCSRLPVGQENPPAGMVSEMLGRAWTSCSR